MASMCPSERESHASPTLNKNLEIIKLDKDGKYKAEIGQKVRPFSCAS